MILFLNLGGGEIFVILLITLLFFGAKGIPDVARTLGRTIRQMKDVTGGIQQDIQESAREMKRDLNIKRHLEEQEQNEQKAEPRQDTSKE